MTDWKLNQLALQKHIETEPFSNFLRWSTVEKTMFVGDVDYVRREYADIMRDRHVTTKVLEESRIGNPKLLWGWTSGNLIHQYYHLKQWQDRSQTTVSQLSAICEIGAGYGAMALICRRLGFTGWYHIEDLPEVKVIQGYYLHNTSGLDNVTWSIPGRCDLLIACHSLSEMPVAERGRLLSQVEADAYLFASSYEFEGVDNERWLGQFAGSKIGYDWAQWAHPYQENAFYMVGTKL